MSNDILLEIVPLEIDILLEIVPFVGYRFPFRLPRLVFLMGMLKKIGGYFEWRSLRYMQQKSKLARMFTKADEALYEILFGARVLSLSLRVCGKGITVARKLS